MPRSEKTELSRLKSELRTLQKKVSSRVSHLRNAGVYSPALDELGSSISVRQDTLAKARNEIIRAKTFLRNPTSKVAYARHFTMQIASMDEMDGISDKWEIFKMIRGHDPSVEVIVGRYTDTVDLIDDYIAKQELTPLQIVERVKSDLNQSFRRSRSIIEGLNDFVDEEDE